MKNDDYVTITKDEYIELLKKAEYADKYRANRAKCGATTWAKMTPEQKTERAWKMRMAQKRYKYDQKEQEQFKKAIDKDIKDLF